MKKKYMFFVFIAFLCLSASSSINVEFISATKKAKDSVVYLSVYSYEKQNKRNILVQTAYGSGVIVSKSGYILTNNHIVNKGKYCQVTLADGTVCEVEKLNRSSYYLADAKTDLAVLKIISQKDLEPINFGNSNSLKEGEWVLAIGNPYGLRNSISSGIVSSLGRYDVGFAAIENFIQTDVPINPGNSGGPLINLEGDMIGINSAIRSNSGGYQGISFSIPSNMARKVYLDLTKYGRVRRGWLGLIVKNDNSQFKNISKGVRISSVIKGSPSEMAGLKDGDYIVAIDGEDIHSKGALMKIVKSKEIGTKLSVTVLRKKIKRTIILQLNEKKSFQKISRIIKKFYYIYGIELSIDSASEDLVVSSVSPFKMYMHANNIKEGDTVVSLNGISINSAKKFARLFKNFKYNVNSLGVWRDSRIFVVDFNKN